MLSKLLPIAFLAVGTAAGIATGLILTPGPAPEEDAMSKSESPAQYGGQSSGKTEFVRLNNQFVVPVVGGDRITALVVIALSLEVDHDIRETIYEREPKLRDLFLRVLFDHANMGGFRGTFTDPDMMEPLRVALLEVARADLGPAVRDVLIVDISRQDS